MGGMSSVVMVWVLNGHNMGFISFLRLHIGHCPVMI